MQPQMELHAFLFIQRLHHSNDSDRMFRIALSLFHFQIDQWFHCNLDK